MEYDQIWAPIPYFPDYEVGSWGMIFNLRRRKTMEISRTTHGHAKVALVNATGRHTRSVSLLVASAFVPAPNPHCDSVILLDGDLGHLEANNLAWRPSWFAWKYTRQLKTDPILAYTNLQVDNVVTGTRYSNIIAAATTEGLLYDDIWRSTFTGDPVYPNGDIFKITEGLLSQI